MAKKINVSETDRRCQVFTPENYVKELLDSVEYCNNILDKTILENSCGDGNILVEIVRRYVKEASKQGYSNKKIKSGLEKNIYGFEIDEKQWKKCILNLNAIVKIKGIENVKWRIYNEDYLKSKIDVYFDFIVGNPPYINYSDLSLEERKFIKETYESCKEGKFDYCYAFIEHSIKSLSSKGKMSYLIPSSIFKTVFGNRLRNFMNEHIYQIKDYTREKIFDEALVKSAIIVFDKNLTNKKVSYLDMSSNNKLSILKSKMNGKWIFSNEFNNGNKRFGDYFKVSHVVATLLNEAFVINEENYNDIDDHYKIGDINIEKEIVMSTASPRTLRYEKKEKIIFPYKYDGNHLVRFEEETFAELYPGAFVYLNQFKERLLKRKSDVSTKWFEYGRSQALIGINCKKLLISTIITDKVCIYKLAEECIPYGGMYISIKEENQDYDLDFAKKILESENFMNYVRKIGINISGNSLRITSKDIENYRF